MAKHGKKYIEMKKKNTTKTLDTIAAIKQAKKNSFSKFLGTLGLHVAMFIPKDKDAKSIKGSIALPYPLEKKLKIAVFIAQEKADEALKAGADKAGLDDLIKEIKAGKIDFDIAIATPDVMPKIAVLGKVLGPKGLMPNPKTGTVSADVKAAIDEYRKGKQNFACDETGVMHFVVGKIDTDDQKVADNINVCIAKAAEAVGKPAKQVVKSIFLAPTMGPSVKIEMTTESESK